MDSDRPAYWLDRSPAEAAGFLARTAVASRRVGGFVKQAAPNWQTALNEFGRDKTVQHALIGAGVGGLGGLGLGMLDRKRKNPWATALTGATLGGLGAGAGSYLYRNPPSTLLAPSPEATRAVAQNEQNEATAYENAPPEEKALANVNIRQVPVPVSATAGGGTAALSPLDAAKARNRTTDLLPSIARRGAVAVGGRVFGHDPGTVTATSLGMGTTLAADVALRQQAARFGEARRAAQAFGRGVGAYKPENVPHVNFALDQIGRAVAGTENPTASSWGRIPGVNTAIRAMREADVGRQILALRRSAGDIRTVPTPRGTGMSLGESFAPQHITNVLHAGGFGEPVPKPSAGRRALGFGGSLAAQFLANAASRGLGNWYAGE
jgi:hypothetical protein